MVTYSSTRFVMADESISSGAPIISLPKITRNFYPILESLLTRDNVSLISESPVLTTPPDPEKRGKQINLVI